MKLKHCGTCVIEVSIEDYFSSFVIEMERRGDVQNKIKEKERVSLKARGMSELLHRACLVSAPETFDFSCTSSSYYFYLSAEFRAACWRTLVALKSANFNQDCQGCCQDEEK